MPVIFPSACRFPDPPCYRPGQLRLPARDPHDLAVVVVAELHPGGGQGSAQQAVVLLAQDAAAAVAVRGCIGGLDGGKGPGLGFGLKGRGGHWSVPVAASW